MLGFVILGLLFTVVVGMFFGLMFTADMEYGWKSGLITIIIALVVGFGIASLFAAEAKADEKRWNNGYCQCGGEWELFDTEYKKNAGYDFWYKCEDCKNVIKTNSRF